MSAFVFQAEIAEVMRAAIALGEGMEARARLQQFVSLDAEEQALREAVTALRRAMLQSALSQWGAALPGPG